MAGEDNIADFFTKALPASVHMRLVQRLTGHLPFCGNRSAARYNSQVLNKATAYYVPALMNRSRRFPRKVSYYHF